MIVSFGILLLFVSSYAVVVCKADESSIDVNFQILNGNSRGEDFYSGDWIYYNITMTNRGDSNINATFTVSIYNPAGSIIGNSRSYVSYLEPNQTVTLYPNNTRFLPTDVDAYFLDTPGTYVLNLTSNVPIVFYRYGKLGSYSWEIGYSHVNIDVMPSYQKVLNEQAQQFYERNQQYTEEFEAYVAESRIETSKLQNLSIIAVIIASMSIVPSYYAIPESRRKKKVMFISCLEVALVVLFIIILLV